MLLVSKKEARMTLFFFILLVKRFLSRVKTDLQVSDFYDFTTGSLLGKDFYESVGFEVTLDTETEKRYIFNIPDDYEVKNKVIDMEIV